jgi:hypothetical protein
MPIRPKMLVADIDRYLRRRPRLREWVGVAFLLGFFAFCLTALVLS